MCGKSIPKGNRTFCDGSQKTKGTCSNTYNILALRKDRVINRDKYRLKDTKRYLLRKTKPGFVEAKNEKSRKRNQQYREEALHAYGGSPPKCACCSESNIEFLAIDHMYGGGNQHHKALRKSHISIYRWLKINDYPSGFQVLCHNCNMSDGFYGYCPHKRSLLDNK